MSVNLDEYKLAYFAVPKTACTSIKTMFFEIENGFPFAPFKASGRTYWIHDFYGSIPFEQQKSSRISEFTRLAVVRDPIRRLLSCYSNRVLHHRELSRDKARRPLRRAELPFDPDLPTFIANLPRYMEVVPSIGHHAAPTVDYLGLDAGYYDTVYGMHQLDDFIARVGAVTGRTLSLPRLQTGGPKLNPEDLTGAQAATLRAFYAEDYAVFGDYF